MQLSGSGALGDFLADYIKTQLKQRYKTLRVRADTFGYLQRSFAGYASPVDQAEARECGRKAVEFAMAGDMDGSVAIKRAKGKAYKASFFRAKLGDVARFTKTMPRSPIGGPGGGLRRRTCRASRRGPWLAGGSPCWGSCRSARAGRRSR